MLRFNHESSLLPANIEIQSNIVIIHYNFNIFQYCCNVYDANIANELDIDRNIMLYHEWVVDMICKKY